MIISTFSHMSYALQLLVVSCFKPFKTIFIKKGMGQWLEVKTMNQMKLLSLDG